MFDKYKDSLRVRVQRAQFSEDMNKIVAIIEGFNNAIAHKDLPTKALVCSYKGNYVAAYDLGISVGEYMVETVREPIIHKVQALFIRVLTEYSHNRNPTHAVKLRKSCIVYQITVGKALLGVYDWLNLRVGDRLGLTERTVLKLSSMLKLGKLGKLGNISMLGTKLNSMLNKIDFVALILGLIVVCIAIVLFFG